MCGIAGQVGQALVSPDYWKSFLSHRGPDGNGIYQAHNLTLAHTRLAILDLSANGHQPMQTSDGRYVVTFNGEIYNHLDLRADLRRRGCQFRSTSDTETLLYGFAEFGTAIFSRLNGIFACAIYDTQTRKLVLARDQFGVKPLYYYHQSDQFLFASELKVIAGYPGIDQSLDYTALSQYLHFLYAPGEQTPLRHVRKLLPGHYLCVSVDLPSTMSIKQYYSLPLRGVYDQRPEAELIEALDQQMRQAVDRQLQSDVPLGFFLSGGLDSSAVVALAAQLRPKEQLTCYTIRTASSQKSYEGFDNDLPYARLVAKHLGVKLIEVAAESDIVRDFSKVIYHLDEPLADTAPINVLNICRQARENGHTVLLGGTAGDDIFSGYRRHQALSMEALFQHLPSGMGKLASAILSQWPGQHPQVRRLQKIAEGLGKQQPDRLADYYGWLPYSINRSLFTPAIQAMLPDIHPRHRLLTALSQIPDESSLLNQLLFWETTFYLPDHNLNYTDKLSMAVGVEARVPFLDVELVNFAARLPPALKMKGRETKYILKKLMERYLPNEVIYRPKTGFGTPLRSWLMAGQLDGLFEQYLSTDVLNRRGIFDPKNVHRLIENTKNGHLDAVYSIWGLVAIEAWCQQFIDAPAYSLLDQ
ncbi:asparagine synthase (glutamine-hydrolyzing) [uncultured Fibrella sp.]|uniref:asparagine synthase (glutamine-hydrolyzing) n=1 Tax=uncultured Fibrella sp. TaxID=1284596 RepID=UPI0035CC0569